MLMWNQIYKPRYQNALEMCKLPQAWDFENNLDFLKVCFIFIVTFDFFPNYLSFKFQLIFVCTAIQNNDDGRKLISQAFFSKFKCLFFKCNLFACLCACVHMWYAFLYGFHLCSVIHVQECVWRTLANIRTFFNCFPTYIHCSRLWHRPCSWPT